MIGTDMKKVRVEGQEQAAPNKETQEPKQGKVRKLTEYFDRLGGSRTPRTPKTHTRTTRTPSRDSTKSGGIKKNRKKCKIEEPQSKKMEAALRNFLKKPPDRDKK